MTTPEETARSVFGSRAAHYATSDAHSDEDVLERLTRAAQPKTRWRALDVATGAGHTAFAIAPHVARVVAVDFTVEMLAQAAALRKTRHTDNVTLLSADAHALPLKKRQLRTCRIEVGAPSFLEARHGIVRNETRARPRWTPDYQRPKRSGRFLRR